MIENDRFSEERTRLRLLAAAFGARGFSDPATEWSASV